MRPKRNMDHSKLAGKGLFQDYERSDSVSSDLTTVHEQINHAYMTIGTQDNIEESNRNNKEKHREV